MDQAVLKKKIAVYTERFDNAFPGIVDELVKDVEQKAELKQAGECLRKAIEYNCFNGKKSRGLMVIFTVDLLHGGEPSDDEINKAIYLGWCVEILQAVFLIADDVMDRSEMRRGRPCWYKKVGLTAINDTYLLEQCIYKLIDDHFKGEPYIFELYKAFHSIIFVTAMGQELDMLASEPTDQPFSLDLFTEEKYKSIVKYKTAYYSFYLPVSLGLHVSKITNPDLFKVAETILVELGEYFQIQDDYLDCFGDPSVTGKIGRDIEDAKCSWLVIQALKIANEEQKELLKLNYGKEDKACVNKVKDLYRALDLQSVYRNYEEESFTAICDLINSHEKSGLPKELFFALVMKIYKREK